MRGRPGNAEPASTGSNRFPPIPVPREAQNGTVFGDSHQVRGGPTGVGPPPVTSVLLRGVGEILEETRRAGRHPVVTETETGPRRPRARGSRGDQHSLEAGRRRKRRSPRAFREGEALPAPGWRAWGLRKGQRMHFCRLGQPARGTSLRKPQEPSTASPSFPIPSSQPEGQVWVLGWRHCQGFPQIRAALI